jgi:serine/threonine-protein kinase ATR
LELSESLRKQCKFDSARVAIHHASTYGLSDETVLLQECRLLKDKGDVIKALMLIEPIEIDVNALVLVLKSNRYETVSTINTLEKRIQLSEKIHLATQLMVESHIKHGRSILDRYNCVVCLNNSWENGYFDFAKYYEYLYYDALNKEASNASNSSITTNQKGQKQVINNNQEEKKSYEYIKNAIGKYCLALKFGSQHIMQSLPKLLTLWLSFTSLQESPLENTIVSNRKQRNLNDNSNEISTLRIVQNEINIIIQQSIDSIPLSTWFLCMPQLVSRVIQRSDEVTNLIIKILISVVSAYPKQGIWHIAGLFNSLNTQRKKISKIILKSCYSNIIKTNNEDAQMLLQSQELFRNLVYLATQHTKERKIKWKIHQEVVLNRFLIPNQTVLRNCDIFHNNINNNSNNNNNNSSNKQTSSSINDSKFSTNADFMFIDSFYEFVDVASSKARPKTLTLITTLGKKVKFLVKQEKDGDLRKDERMMEFNTVVNRLLKNDAESKKRNLRLRTYSVVCLNEECGVLEWVNNTDCVRQLITEAHDYSPDLYPLLTYRDIYQEYLDLQTKYEDDIDKMKKSYKNLIKDYKPCFHKFFIQRFDDPTEWFEARNVFTCSAAVWSVIGHVIGLGDRHTENILIDLTNGECVHVDFDCLFDKGLTLQKPEIIPFRLTPNFVDAMGPLGVEGTFRRTMEICLRVLRANKDALLSVLEPFLRDPTVSWSRTGRAQKNMENWDISVNNNQNSAILNTNKQTSNFHDHENKEATEMLQKISERLNGIYNIFHPNRERILRGYKKRNEVMLTSKGIGALKEDALPFSIQGQVNKLIDEASAEENLAQLYIGNFFFFFSNFFF